MSRWPCNNRVSFSACILSTFLCFSVTMDICMGYFRNITWSFCFNVNISVATLESLSSLRSSGLDGASDAKGLGRTKSRNYDHYSKSTNYWITLPLTLSARALVENRIKALPTAGCPGMFKWPISARGDPRIVWRGRRWMSSFAGSH